ncbi:MAG: hypothetical protein PHE27_08515, partial [Alphaproteobacteria bacterium]|nr:hypothetical protein [Alphaproteobacteria bacterium]
ALEAKLKREALRERMEHDEEFWFNRSRKKQNEPERDYLELLLFLYVLSSFSRSFARFFTWFKPKRESQKPVPK